MKRTFLGTIVLVLAAMAFLAPSAPAQSKGFLKISGIAGESKDADHRGWIDVLSFAWGARAPANGSGPGSLKVTIRAGKAAPGLKTKSGGGAKIPEVVLEVGGAGTDGKPGIFLYKMTDVTIGAYDPSGSGSDDLETITLNYSEVSVTYTPQK